MLRSSSFLKRTVRTPEMALTTVDFPWATWPIVPLYAGKGGGGESVARTRIEAVTREVGRTDVDCTKE